MTGILSFLQEYAKRRAACGTLAIKGQMTIRYQVIVVDSDRSIVALFKP